MEKCEKSRERKRNDLRNVKRGSDMQKESEKTEENEL